MSDCFDHELDAFECSSRDDPDGGYNSNDPCVGHSQEFQRNPLFYHTKVSITGICKETDKAYMLECARGRFWVPKSLCRKLREHSVYIFNKFSPKYIEFTTTPVSWWL
jgi:hypothetical protein